MNPTVRWLTRYDRAGASSRYRVYQYVGHPLLGDFEHLVTPMSRRGSSIGEQIAGVGHRILDARRRAPGEIVVVQKEPVMPPLVTRVLSHTERWSGPVLWDVDDAVWIGRRGAGFAATWMARRSDLVIAGNDLIAEWASSHGALDVTVIPTTFTPAHDGSPPDRVNERTSDAVKMVWIGSPATTPLLDRFAPTISSWLAATPGLRLEVVGAGPSEVVKLPGVLNTAWSPEAENAALSSADYGLALQPSGGYNDFKCGFKIVQYLSHGVIPIATDGVVHRSLCEGVGLLLGDDRQDSGAVLDRIASPPSSADRAAAIERWRERFSTEVGARQWAGALRKFT